VFFLFDSTGTHICRTTDALLAGMLEDAELTPSICPLQHAASPLKGLDVPPLPSQGWKL